MGLGGIASTVFQSTIRAARQLPGGEALAQGLWFARYARDLRRASGAVYSSKHGAVLEQVREQGYAVIEGYWSRSRCESAIEEIDRCIREFSVAIHRRDDERIFGLERLSRTAAEFHEDPLHRELADEYTGSSNAIAFTLGNRIAPREGSTLGSGGDWHRDGFLPELKTLLYLSDVSEENGPFGYYKGSHRPTAILSDMRRLGLGFQQARIHRAVTRFTESEALARRRFFTKPAGTLLVFDTSGIHTGAPIHSGVRYALTNYIVAAASRPAEDALRHFSPIVVDGPNVLLASGEKVPLRVSVA